MRLSVDYKGELLRLYEDRRGQADKMSIKNKKIEISNNQCGQVHLTGDKCDSVGMVLLSTDGCGA